MRYDSAKRAASRAQRAAVLCSLFAVLCSLPVPAEPPKLPAFPPLNFKPPKADRAVLENGIVVYLLEDHELPLIKMEMYFQGGTQADPLDKIGLGGMFGDVMTYGGSLSHPPEEIERTLNRKAASISFSVGLENGTGSLGCRTQDFDTIFGLYTDLVLHPLFRKDQVDLAKSKVLESLRRMNDDPDDVARRELRKVMYGAHHPYARIPTPAMIKNIKQADFIAAHTRFLRPNGTMIAISGDFKRADMLAKIKTAFGGWAKSEVQWPPVPAPVPAKERRVYYIQSPINQSQIRIGELGLPRHSPDHFAWEVFNELWGGSASSRLFRIVRTQMGLAYSVGTGYSEPAQQGLVVAVAQTRGAQTMASLQAILNISKEVRSASFTPAEISDAKEAIRNRFIENFASSSQIAAYVMNLEFFGFPSNYLETYTDRIANVSAEDLRRVGQAYIHPERGSILIMGDLSTFDKPLSTVGKPQEIKLIDYAQEP